MNRMIHIFLLLFFMVNILAAHTQQKEYKKVPLELSLPLLKSIEAQALLIGNGPTQVHLFIDPLCPLSKEFITLISESKRMQKLYSYKVHLYELKRFHSRQLIQNIYACKKPLQALLSYIVEDKEIKSKKNNTVSLKKMQAVVDVALKLHVDKRPFLVLVKKRK